MDTEAIIRQVVAVILRHAKPERIYLHGSRVTGEAGETSDIDIAFEDRECTALGVIKDEIEGLKTLIKIDISNLAFTEERFRNRVRETGRILYSASKKLRAEDAMYNYSRALERFREAVATQPRLLNEGLGDVYCDLIVKRFEFTFEMSWKALKRVLDLNGISVLNPRACYKEAFAQGLIREQEVWLDMIESRNLSSHVYDANQIKPILLKVDKYLAAFQSLMTALNEGLK